MAATHLYTLQKKLAGRAPKGKEDVHPSYIKLQFDRMVKVGDGMIFVCHPKPESERPGLHANETATGRPGSL